MAQNHATKNCGRHILEEITMNGHVSNTYVYSVWMRKRTSTLCVIYHSILTQNLAIWVILKSILWTCPRGWPLVELLGHAYAFFFEFLWNWNFWGIEILWNTFLASDYHRGPTIIVHPLAQQFSIQNQKIHLKVVWIGSLDHGSVDLASTISNLI